MTALKKVDDLWERVETLEGALRHLEHEKGAVERRLRLWRTVACLVVGMSLAILPLRKGSAQGVGSQAGGLPSTEQRLTTLEATVRDQADEDAALRDAVAAEAAARQAADNSLQNQVAPLAAKLEKVSVRSIDGYYSIVIEGANLHLRNGLGATNGFPPVSDDRVESVTNGLGNLIVGYNETRESLSFTGPDERWGSHNIVVGTGHNFTKHGGLVVGYLNEIRGPYASVSGGSFNRATDFAASVSGGGENEATGAVSSVNGGLRNLAEELFATVSGGAGLKQPNRFGWSAGGFYALGGGSGSFHDP